jgi:myosin heavy subunit
MYGFKEKAKHLRELHSTAHAEADISLLRRLSPQHKLNKVQFPSRKAEEILFALLDLTTAEAIRDNRKELNLLKEKENEVQSDTTTKSGTEEDTHTLQPEQSGTGAPEQSGTNPEGDTKAGDVNDQSTQDGPVTDAQQTVDPEEHEQLKAELEETKEQLEELEGAAEELEEKTEELESATEELEGTKEELEAVKEELAAEKKNQPKPKQEPKASTKAKTTKAKK